MSICFVRTACAYPAASASHLGRHLRDATVTATAAATVGPPPDESLRVRPASTVIRLTCLEQTHREAVKLNISDIYTEVEL